MGDKSIILLPIMDASKKTYGLVIPQKSNRCVTCKPNTGNIFGDVSEEEEVSGTVTKRLAPVTIRKQTQLDIDKALEQDPDVYEYDSIYDDIHRHKPGSNVKQEKSHDRKPKYIGGLLKMAELRKQEEERRLERKVQRERDDEGELFASKDSFVTSAYKKKMQERERLEEVERHRDAMEEMLDVTKQKDLSGFYRYMFRETTGSTTTKGHEEKGEERGEEDDCGGKVPGSRVHERLTPYAGNERESSGRITDINACGSSSSDPCFANARDKSSQRSKQGGRLEFPQPPDGSKNRFLSTVTQDTSTKKWSRVETQESGSLIECSTDVKSCFWNCPGGSISEQPLTDRDTNIDCSPLGETVGTAVNPRKNTVQPLNRGSGESQIGGVVMAKYSRKTSDSALSDARRRYLERRKSDTRTVGSEG